MTARYRLGQYNEAISALNRLSRVSRLQPTVLFFAAMTHHSLGQANEARRELAAAIAAMGTTANGSTSPNTSTGCGPHNWADKVAEKLLRKEAEALILDSSPDSGAPIVPEAPWIDPYDTRSYFVLAATGPIVAGENTTAEIQKSTDLILGYCLRMHTGVQDSCESSTAGLPMCSPRTQ